MSTPEVNAESEPTLERGIIQIPDVSSTSEADMDISTTTASLASRLVGFRKPDGLILSTGNLYFTYHDAATASVWRAGQSANPGQEILLYSEPGAIFGDIVFAQVDGAFFGYFFAQEVGSATITIKRVPLTGGAAITLTTLTNVDIANSHRNLVTDGEFLYWQDVDSVRKMPIRGGAITVLDQTAPSTPTAGIALQLDNVIYAAGDTIHFVPKSGDAITSPLVRTIARASSRVTALHTVSNGVYWGEQGGAVRVIVGSSITTLQTINDQVPTSISSNGFTVGAAQAWTQCDPQLCRLQLAFPATNGGEDIDSGALGVTVTSSGSVFWGDASGVHRRAF